MSRPTAVVDELVRVGDGRLHVRCVGAGDTTVVLIAGFNDGGDNWGRITPALSGHARVCSYARFGTGASDPPTTPQTFATSARDLHALLNEIGEPGPYVVVGHSYGGAQAVTFAARYPDEVDGLLLLDATPPTWTAAGCAVPDDGSEAAAGFVARCPDPALPTDNPEQLDEVAGFADVAGIDTLGSLPLSVVTAAEHPFPGLDPVEAARLHDVWDQGQEHWMSLSSAAQLVTVEDTGHYIQLDRPDAVIAEIREAPSASSRSPRRRHRFGGSPAATACSAAPSTSPSTPPTRPVATVSLSLARLPATDPDARIGTLITNPGGPGGSGVEFLGDDGPFNDEINRRFDIVSWDPRGVGGSAPLQCGSGFADTFLSTDLAPRDAAGRAALERVARRRRRNLRRGRRFPPRAHRYRRCRVGPRSDPAGARRRPDHLRRLLLRHAHRAPLRRALPRRPAGDGARRRHRTRRRPRRSTRRHRRLPRPIPRRDPRRLRARLPHQRRPAAGLPRSRRGGPHRAAALRRRHDVGFNAVGMAGIAVTYDEELRAPFYEAIAQAQHGDGTLFELFAEGFVEEFELGPNFAVDCLDLPHPTTSAEVEALASQAAGAATVLPELSGAYVRVFALPCLDWPVQAPTELEQVTAAGTPPILVVGNTGDPVTPFESAEHVAATLEQARLLTYMGGGHTTYGKDDCADAHIDSYLIDLDVPAESTVCG